MAFVCPECGGVQFAPGFCTEHGVALNDNVFCPLLGEMVGSYRVATLIGQGGMGEVYLGVQPEIGSRVAIKVLNAEALRSPALVDRFFAEARAVNVIRHEGIVSVHDLSQLSDRRPYIVMEYLEGAPLSRVFEQHRPMPLGGFLHIVLAVLDALGAAHARGITHRDLKPDNVFITTTGRTKLLDFGIAKLKPEVSRVSDATRTGALLGTPFYMSPEQARGQHVDHRSDLYSLGLILFEGATGQRPFVADNLFDLLRLQIEALPPSPRDLRPDLPAALETVIVRALEKDPARRFQSTDQLSSALRETAQFLPAQSFVTLTGEPSSLPKPMLAVASGAARTASGYAATVGTTRATSAPRRSSSLGLVALAFGLGAVLFGAVAVAAGAAWYFRSASPAGSGAAARGSASREDTATPPQRGIAGGADLNHVDPVAFLPRARALARSQIADVELSTFSADGVGRNGVVDFQKGNGSITYTFLSPKASAGQTTGRCAVTVGLSGGAPVVTVPPVAVCFGGVARAPRCSLARILGSAGAKEPTATVTYGPAPSWTVVAGDDMRFVPDDC